MTRQIHALPGILLLRSPGCSQWIENVDAEKDPQPMGCTMLLQGTSPLRQRVLFLKNTCPFSPYESGSLSEGKYFGVFFEVPTTLSHEAHEFEIGKVSEFWRVFREAK